MRGERLEGDQRIGPRNGLQSRQVCGHDFGQISEVIEAAIENAARPSDSPMLILAHTVKGKGVDFMEGQVPWHYGSVDSDLATRAKASIMGGA